MQAGDGRGRAGGGAGEGDAGDGPAMLVFGPDGLLNAWNAAAAALPALAGGLRTGVDRGALSGRLADREVVDQRLTDGSTVCLVGGRGGLTPERGSRLFAAASHDLRQPLAALSLLVGAMDGRVGDPAAREVLKAMGSAVQSMKSMVDGHFDLARLEAGLIEPEPAPIAVNGILTRLALEFAPRFEGRRLRFTVMPCSAMIESDAALLERILQALLSNTLRHMGRGRVLLGCRRRGDGLLVGVWDSGRGLPPEELQALREAMEHPSLGGSAGRVLGLGLTLAGRLARRLGLRPVVESAPARGSLFGVVVPRAAEGSEEAAAPIVPEEPPAADVSRARVLVIEDDRMVLDALGVLLSQWGCAVIGADSYDAAMARLGPDPVPPDLVVADLRLKGAANGIVAIRQIAKALNAAVPGLVLTGDTDPTRLREARLSGYPILHKPVAPLALRAVLGKLLGRDRLAP
ncbi:hybrid sensor histidine kinase/response regulator [Azospirillum sp. ST 5-10]|uniref:hybrid sensor histidine kinase/response regulator n=1 Tax=unclassified Azospirillum TaxID=2630922 RepID=UPI003F49D8F7